MKLVKYDVRKERGKLRLFTAWRNQMRQPRTLKVISDKAEDYNPTEMAEFKDAGEMAGFINGMAEIAWAKGWRPRGLVNTVSHVVANFKEPPAQD